MELILLSSIPGLDIKQIIQNIKYYSKVSGKDKNIKDYCLEKEYINPAKPFLKEILVEPLTGYSLTNVLQLPNEYLNVVCRKALKCIISKITKEVKNNDIPILSFHPVLFHQITSEFTILPWLTIFQEALSDSKINISIKSVVSIHDDIYDIYRRLLSSPTKLYFPNNTRKPKFDEESCCEIPKREPEQDLVEIRQILDWRDRELSVAHSIAQGISAAFFLFHRKTLTKTILEAVFEAKPFIYFSHPISQPRSDLIGKQHPQKNKFPSRERGLKFINECQKIADYLNQVRIDANL